MVRVEKKVEVLLLTNIVNRVADFKLSATFNVLSIHTEY